MAASRCSFRTIVGGDCSYDRRDPKRSVEIIPLISCNKDIGSHKSTWAFSGVETEEELILVRAGVFYSKPQDRSSMNICPYHRSELGIGWRRSKDICKIPEVLATHKTVKKGDRGVGKEISKVIFQKAGVLVPFGSGICRTCRAKLESKHVGALSRDTENITLDEKDISSNKHVVQDVDALSRDMKNIVMDDEITLTTHDVQDAAALSRDMGNITLDELSFTATPQKSRLLCQPETPGSFYQPTSDSSDEGEVSLSSSQPSSREKLNSFLESRDVSPIRNQLKTYWDEASDRTKRYYTKKAREVVSVALQEIAPNDSAKLWKSVANSKSLNLDSSLENEDNLDAALIEALAECYNNATHWSTRRQILSIMADKVSFKALQRWIPGITRYRFNIGRHHLLLHGRGTPLSTPGHTRMYVSSEKLDHFLDFITSAHIIQDLPFGTRKLVLSNREEITVPNVVRTLIPERIIQQYEVVCKETGFTPLGRSTLHRILNSCSASVRKSLQGLDYFSADGAKSFDDLDEVVHKIGDSGGVGLSWAKEKKEKLKVAKRYLKGDYKVHVSTNSTIADHCRNYALSSPSDKDFRTACDHEHDDSCDRCHTLTSVIDEIEEGLEKGNFSKDTKEELAFDISNAKNNINAWKAHLMRSVNQDECRLEILRELDTTSVLLVEDWAMKYLPKKFRESQTDWFGKRGIPWHITVVFRRAENGELEMLTFVHVFEASNQDNCDVIAILNDVFRQLKSDNPHLKTIHMRQDNATCYHCALTMFTAYQAAKINNLHLKSMDFSDPQGGKGSCDRKAATIKSHMAVHLKSGHDIETAAQMKGAIDSFGGVSGVNVRLCGRTDTKGCTNVKWPGVSLINNIQFSEEGLKVWKAYNIGPGKCIPWKNLDVPDKENVPSLVIKESNASGFVPVKPRKSTSSQPRSHKEEDRTASEQQGIQTEERIVPDQHLFTCPEEGCIKSYVRYSALQKHLDCGKHQRALENETLFDRAIMGYASRLEASETAVPKIMDKQLCHPSNNSPLAMGWALKSASGRKHFSTKQKDYLKAIFDIGQQSGKKANPSNVAQEMKTAKDKDGNRLFSSDEFLTVKQITGFFSRQASKGNNSADNEDLSDDELAEIEQQSALQEIKAALLSDVSIQHSHPIVYETYNICDMVKKSTLTKKFSIEMLNHICHSFGLDTSSIKVKRKKPYEDLITNLVMGCKCMTTPVGKE